MRKYLAVILFFVFIACAGGCGNSKFNPAALYDTPAQPAPANARMGGAVQGTPLPGATTVSVFAGTTGVAGLLDSSGATAQFNHPTDITTDGTFFYVSDYLNNAVRRIDTAGVVTTLVLSDADTGLAIALNRPSGITTDGTTIYLVDSGSNSVRCIDSASSKVTTIGSTTGIAGSIDSAIKTDVRFNQPTGITTDGVNLYVTDSGNHTIRRIAIATKAVSTLAGTAASVGSSDGIQAAALFDLPARITTDGTNLYVTDFYNRTVRKIVIATGAVSTIAGLTGVSGSDDATETGATARFNQPNGITTDGTYLYVSDSYNDTIRRITLSSTSVYSGPVSTIAGGVGVSGSADGDTISATFNTPVGITTDGKALYVADSGNHTIRKINR